MNRRFPERLEPLTVTKQLMTNTSPSGTDCVQLAIFDLQPFHNEKLRKPPKSKRCTRCNKKKPIEGFALKKKGKYGRHAYCKTCCCEIELNRKATPKSPQGLPILPENHKPCTRCKAVFPFSGFHAAYRESDGLSDLCKACDSAKSKERYERRKVQEKKEITFAYKKCTRCLQYREVAEFRSYVLTSDNLSSWCNPCKNADGSRYKKENKAKAAAIAMKRYLARKAATPLWANNDAILAIYEESERLGIETGIPREVDHILPITNKLICGLHVENNLRVITGSENARKHNKFTPYVWSDLTPEQQQSPLYNPFWRDAKES